MGSAKMNGQTSQEPVGEKHVFVSYAHEDGDFAELLSLRLEKTFTVWNDFQGIRAGDRWRREIESGIRNAFVTIVIISPESKKSEFVTYEWSYSLGAGIDVVPVLYKATEEVHPQLSELQYLDFSHRDTRPWRDLVERLCNLAEKAQRAELEIEDVPRAVSKTQADPSKLIQNAVFSLNNGDSAVRLSAIENLEQAMPHSQARSALHDALGHVYRDVRLNAAFSLARHGDGSPEVRRELANALISGNQDLRWKAVTAFEELNTPEAAQDLRVDLGKSEDADVRAAAAAALGRMKSEAAVPELVEALRDGDATVRWNAASALGEIRPTAPEAITGLKRLLEDDDHPRWGMSSSPGSIADVAGESLKEIYSKEAHAALKGANSPDPGSDSPSQESKRRSTTRKNRRGPSRSTGDGT
jgi:HEAT repeat protein